MEFNWKSVIAGIVVAATMSGAQFVAKMKTGEPFDFSVKKLGRTMAAGAGAWLVTWLNGVAPDMKEPLTIGGMGFLTGIFDVGSKFIWRLFSKKK